MPSKRVFVGRCAVCGKTNGSFQKVTYDGAPDGGVTMHMSCTPQFFEALERKQWQEDMNDAYIAAKV